jgi:hypothetical protein
MCERSSDWARTPTSPTSTAPSCWGVQGKVLSLCNRLVLREGTTRIGPSPEMCDWGGL